MMPNFTHSTKEYLSGTYHMSSTVLSMGMCIWKEKAPVLRENQFRGGTVCIYVMSEWRQVSELAWVIREGLLQQVMLELWFKE